ncbi:hypothetical protein M9H77_00447 [Catharanthus roseus]|nr:hypothetical protein M9H77_00447 [Catharanthus roseus]
MSIENQEDVCVHEPKVIITYKESGLMPLIGDMFSIAYHMLCRRHIDQNVLAKLTELTKDEEVASRFVNGSWNKLLNEIDEQEYVRKLDTVKTKWKTYIKASLEFSRSKEKFNGKSNQILRMVSNKISHLALKKIWNEISRATEIFDDPKNKCEHYMRTSDSLPCSCELITGYDHTLLIKLVNIEAFWKSLEIGSCHPSARQHMDFHMRCLTDLLHQISTGPISKVREMHRLAKRVLSPVLPEDPGVTLTSPPESSGSGSGSGSSSGSGSGSRGRRRLPRAPSGKGRGHAYPSLCCTFPYTNASSAFIYPFISNWKNLVGDGNCERVHELIHRTQGQDGPAPLEHWLETPDSPYIIANAFNLCGVTLVIDLLREQQHFIEFYQHLHFSPCLTQLQMHDEFPIPPLHI